MSLDAQEKESLACIDDKLWKALLWYPSLQHLNHLLSGAARQPAIRKLQKQNNNNKNAQKSSEIKKCLHVKLIQQWHFYASGIWSPLGERSQPLTFSHCSLMHLPPAITASKLIPITLQSTQAWREGGQQIPAH